MIQAQKMHIFLDGPPLLSKGSGLQNQDKKISILKDHNLFLFDIREQFWNEKFFLKPWWRFTQTFY